MGVAIFKLDRDRKFLNADVTWIHPVDLKSVEPIQKHINKCEQRIIPEPNAIILLKLRHDMTYNHISSNLVSGAVVMGLRPSNLDYFPISMISGIFRYYYCGIFGYCSKHYIFKKYFLRVDCLFNNRQQIMAHWLI